MPLHLFRNRAFSGINLMTLLHYTGLSSIFFFLTLNFQQAQGYSAFVAGLAQLPIPLCLFLVSRQAGWLTDRVGPLRVMTAGVLLAGGSFLLLTLPGVGANYWTGFLPAELLFGVGNGLTFVPLTAIALGSLPSRYSGIASGLNNAVARVAQMLAVAVFGMLMTATFRASLAERVDALVLDPGARARLFAEAGRLGATQPPPGLAPELTAAVAAAIRLAFVDGFRQILVIAFALVLAGLTALYAFVGFRAARVPSPRPAPASLE